MNRTTKYFVKRTITRIVVFTVLMIIVSAVLQSVSPVVSNQMALGQMQNSDEMFVLMETYNKVRPITNAAKVGIILWFTCTIARDTYTFVKLTKIENKKGEN